MTTLVVRRALQTIPVVIGVTLATFLLSRVIPGDAADVLLGPGASEEAYLELSRALGLDRPLHVQYLLYLERLVRGDLGQSISYSQPVSQVLASRLANTAILAVTATGLAAIAGVAIGTAAALRPGSARDHGLTVSVLFLNSMPPFWLGLVLILVFGLHLRLLPVGGMYAMFGGGLLDLAAHLVLPAVTLAAWSLAVIARMTRSALLDVINSEYVRTARSRGLSEARVVVRHALLNAAPPVITVIGMQMGFLLSGAVLTETVFSWPGIGLAMYQAIGARDIPLIQGGILLLAVVFVAINFAVDVLYAYVNPRIRVA